MLSGWSTSLVVIFPHFLSSSSFGIILVTFSKEKLVTARDVFAAGPQPRPKMETVIITLMHLAYHSENIELQVIYYSLFLEFSESSWVIVLYEVLTSYSFFFVTLTSYSLMGETQAVFMMCAVSAIDPCQRYFSLVCFLFTWNLLLLICFFFFY